MYGSFISPARKTTAESWRFRCSLLFAVKACGVDISLTQFNDWEITPTPNSHERKALAQERRTEEKPDTYQYLIFSRVRRGRRIPLPKKMRLIESA
jgi:hypothetical protein